MKRFFLALFSALMLVSACTKEADVPDTPDTPTQDMIVGSWSNLGSSYMQLTEAGSSDRLFFDAGAITFTFHPDGMLVMEYQETELLMAGTDTTAYRRQGDTLLLDNGTTYMISKLLSDTLFLEYHEWIEGGEYDYSEHLEMVRQ